MGGRILHEHFTNPDFTSRIAALIVVANAHPPFSLRRGNAPVTMLEERRCFFAKVCCSFVNAVFEHFFIPGSERERYYFRFPSPATRERFLRYLETMDVAEITYCKKNPSDEKKGKAASKCLAREVLAVEQFISPCITQVPTVERFQKLPSAEI